MKNRFKMCAVIIVFGMSNVAFADAESEKTRFKDCWQDYQELMRDAQSAAMDSYPPGNLASPEAAPAYNKAMRKQARCMQIMKDYEKKYGKMPTK